MPFYFTFLGIRFDDEDNGWFFKMTDNDNAPVELYLKTIGATTFYVTPDPQPGCKYYFVQAFVCYFILDTELFEEKGYNSRFLSTNVPSNWITEERGWDHANFDQGNRFVRIFLDDDQDRVPLVSE